MDRRVWLEDEIIAWQNAVDGFDPRRGRGKGPRRVRAASASEGKADARDRTCPERLLMAIGIIFERAAYWYALQAPDNGRALGGGRQ